MTTTGGELGGKPTGDPGSEYAELEKKLREIAATAADNSNFARAHYCAGRAVSDDLRNLRDKPEDFFEWKVATAISSLREERDAATARANSLQEYALKRNRAIDSLDEANTALREKVRVLSEALRPFADAVNECPFEPHPAREAWVINAVDLGHFEAAADALNEQSEQPK